jgi:hypothetical protein
MALAHLLGLQRLGNAIHDCTVPPPEKIVLDISKSFARNFPDPEPILCRQCKRLLNSPSSGYYAWISAYKSVGPCCCVPCLNKEIERAAAADSNEKQL